MEKFFLRNIRQQYNQLDQLQTCCICGRGNCEEAVNHEKLTIKQLRQSIQKKLCHKDQIEEIKQRVSQVYREIKRSLINLVQKDQYELMTCINRFYFPLEICHNSKIEISLIAQIIEKNAERLPNKRIGKIIKKMQSLPQINDTLQLQTLIQQCKEFQQNFILTNIIANLKPNLPSTHFKEQLQEIKLKSKTSVSSVNNPQQTDQDKIYEWRNIKVTKNSRTVSLSNKNISDREVMEQIPILSNYKNLRELQIRNNKISCLSCSLIANNMSFLQVVDIRGNKIGDKGIIKIIQRIPNLKSFFISETLATDEVGEEVAKGLHQLEMFWSEHTKISNQVALRIAQKPKLKVLSFLGNPIDEEYKQRMKKIFISKGYINI